MNQASETLSAGALASLAGAGGEFRVGRTFSRASQLFARNLPKLIVLGAIAQAALIILSSAGVFRLLPTGYLSLRGWILPIVLSSLVFRPFAEAAVVQAALQYWSAGRVRLLAALAKALARLIPAVAVTLLVKLAFAVALLTPMLFRLSGLQGPITGLLPVGVVVVGLVGAAWLGLIWSVALPACVAEQHGPIASLRRSAHLTRGHRAKIFGIFLLLLPVSYVFAQTAGGTWSSDPIGVMQGVAWGLLALDVIWESFAACVLATLFHQLRGAREGVDVERVKAVFD
jgi:hypothetical protein